jgi:hypothetical protein
VKLYCTVLDPHTHSLSLSPLLNRPRNHRKTSWFSSTDGIDGYGGKCTTAGAAHSSPCDEKGKRCQSLGRLAPVPYPCLWPLTTAPRPPSLIGPSRTTVQYRHAATMQAVSAYSHAARRPHWQPSWHRAERDPMLTTADT